MHRRTRYLPQKHNRKTPASCAAACPRTLVLTERCIILIITLEMSAYVKQFYNMVNTYPPTSSFAKACLDSAGAMTFSSLTLLKRLREYKVEELVEAGQYPLFTRSMNSGAHCCWHVWHANNGWCHNALGL